MITLTAPAVDRIQALLAKRGTSGEGMRIGVRGGGCSGNSYYMEFCAGESDGDQVIEAGDVKVYVDARSATVLEGTQVDFVTGLMESGFKFINPNSRHQCACGESFSA